MSEQTVSPAGEPRKRADVLLHERGLCESRERAQAAIRAGEVCVGERKVRKPSELLPANAPLTLRAQAHPYVGRGGLKLEKALSVFHADVAGMVCMDIGCATGGFTDVLLRAGAAHVYAIDVGFGQFDPQLARDPRVTLMEHTNARSLTPEMVPLRPTVTVMDVSFISIRLILPAAAAVMGPDGVFYTLIKPQFEAGRGRVGKNGVVRDPAVHEDVLNGIAEFCATIGWQLRAVDFSPITGPKGNIEFLAEIRPFDPACAAPDRAAVHRLVSAAHSAL